MESAVATGYRRKPRSRVVALGLGMVLLACDSARVDYSSAATGISLDRNTLSLVSGGPSVTLVATVEPANAKNQSLLWSTNRGSVATVSSTGEVTPVAEGTATIEVTTVNGGFSDSCTVTVTSVETRVILSPDSLSLVVGGPSATLVATFEPSTVASQDVAWSSSDEKVASVSSTGVVTPRGSGVAIIQVTAADGVPAPACDVIVVPDAVSDLLVDTPRTGQVVISWTASTDPNLTGVRVVVTSSDSSAEIPVEQTVAPGSALAVLSGLSYPAEYRATLTAIGRDGMAATPVERSVSTLKVTRVVRSAYMEGSNQFILDETNGSATQETHDVVIVLAEEAGIPTNFRWTLFPGLADPTDAALVSIMLESYNETTGEWELTDRYLRVNAAYTHVSYNYGQWYAWANPDPNSHIAHCDLHDTTDTFSEEATFRMISGSEVDSVAFEWYPEPSRRLLHNWYHVMAQERDTIDSDPDRSTWRFDIDSSWYLDPP